MKQLAEFAIAFDRDRVFHYIDCYPDSPVYEEAAGEFEALKEKVTALIKPRAVMEYGEWEGEQALFVLSTVGDGAEKWSTQLFAEGDYLGGMLVNAMADDALFQMDQPICDAVRKLCSRDGFGVRLRAEAPLHVPMEAQKKAFDLTDAGNTAGLRILESFMYDPVKSNCQIFFLTEDRKQFRLEHDCSICPLLDCKMRTEKAAAFQVLVKAGRNEYSISCGAHESLLQAMIREKILVTAVCGGAGLCGKCRVRLTAGELAVTTADRRFFSEQELENGCRLSCKAYPEGDCGIELFYAQEQDFDVVGGYVSDSEKAIGADEKKYKKGYKGDPAAANDVAVDIGTTTIAMAMGEEVYTAMNRQRSYGADVITRIQASNEGMGEVMREAVRQSLADGFHALCERAGIKLSQIGRVAVAGNTTMLHLLLGYSCRSLGVSPFTPVSVERMELPCSEVFGIPEMTGTAILLPGISAFVGADIVSGLYACEFKDRDKNALFVDLGTNGEMAVGRRDFMLCTSTAAGPAFEGGNIRFGTGSIAGAVCHAEFLEEKLQIETIGGRAPVGICGTGVVEITAALLQAELMDETGRLEEEYAEDGYPVAEKIVFTQKDIREIQLAKSAVRAGIETLLLRCGITYEDVETVYLAGGFGYRMDITKAAAIGLLPPELTEKVQAVGNSSLEGARRYLLEGGAKEALNAITGHMTEISLAEDKDFNDLYMEYMMFE